MAGVMPNLKTMGGKYLFLEKLWRQFDKIDSVKFYYPKMEGETRGLTDLVYKFLGKHKYMGPRISMWNTRPLREDQIKYAAIDVVCLLETYKAMQNELPRIQFEQIILDTMAEGDAGVAAADQEEVGAAGGQEEVGADISQKLVSIKYTSETLRNLKKSKK